VIGCGARFAALHSSNDRERIIKHTEQPAIPEQLYRELSTLVDRFEALNRAGHPSPIPASELAALLPPELRQCPVFLCSLAGTWRYEYGEPIDDLPYETVVFGTDQCPPVEQLYRSLAAAVNHLSHPDLEKVIQRLGLREKHQEVLADGSTRSGS
jgi:hypothetical protein